MGNDLEGFIERSQVFFNEINAIKFRLPLITGNWYSLTRTRGVSRENL